MSTNYFITLITVAEDTPTQVSIEPDTGKSSVALQQFQMISDAPYAHTSDDVIFARVAEKEGIDEADIAVAQSEYFAQGRACLRTSPLAKQYGWGIHSNEQGGIALVAMESDRYAELVADDTVKKVAAMRRSKR